MKKKWFIITVVLTVQSIFSQKTEINNTIKINTLGVFKKYYELQYERVINEKSSIQVGIGILKNNSNELSKFQEFHEDNFGQTLGNVKDASIQESGFAMNIDYRYYYMKSNKSPRGLYLSPSLQYIKSNSNYTAYEQSSLNSGSPSNNFVKREYTREESLINIRTLIGCQLVIANRVCLNPYFGPSYAFGSIKSVNAKDESKGKGILLNFGIYLGFGF